MPLDPFLLFCAYHLGLFPDGRVQFANVHQVALEFDASPEEVQEALADHGLDSDTLIHAGFDIASAQVDIQVSPEGVDLFALARMHYEHALKAQPETRDWEAELEADKKANEDTYGKE